MKKKERYNKKNLRNRLSAIMAIYMDGLAEKKKKRLEKYLDDKLKNVVDYYVALLKKKDRKNRVLPPQASELSVLSKPADEIIEEAENASPENNLPPVNGPENVTAQSNQQEIESPENLTVENNPGEIEKPETENTQYAEKEPGPLSHSSYA